MGGGGTRRENREALKQSIVDRQAAMAGIFGRISPQLVNTFAV